MKEAIDNEKYERASRTPRRDPADRDQIENELDGRMMTVQLDELTQGSGEWLRGDGPEADIVISSRVRLARNLAEFPFISRATPQDRTESRKSCTSGSSASTPASELLYVDVANWRRSTASFSSSGT